MPQPQPIFATNHSYKRDLRTKAATAAATARARTCHTQKTTRAPASTTTTTNVRCAICSCFRSLASGEVFSFRTSDSVTSTCNHSQMRALGLTQQQASRQERHSDRGCRTDPPCTCLFCLAPSVCGNRRDQKHQAPQAAVDSTVVLFPASEVRICVPPPEVVGLGIHKTL